MDYYHAVAAQPESLERSALVVSECLAATDLGPWAQGLLVVAAMGAGSYAADALVHRLRSSSRRAMNISASELMALPANTSLADCFLFISESGRSRETIEAARRVPVGSRLVLTNATSSPLASLADAVIALDHGEDSAVSTVGYTATLQALGILATAIGRSVDEAALADLAELPDRVRAVLGALAAPSAEVAATIVSATSIDVVGSGASRAAACESALLLRESARFSASAHETHQFLHGPMEALTSKQACIVFGSEREVPLARYLARAAINTVLVTSQPVASEGNLSVLRIPFTTETSQSVLEIIPVQLIAGELAKLKDLGIGSFLFHQDDTKVDSP
jgi:fructoselysine-6-P-deglycase FrlB-like protein